MNSLFASDALLANGWARDVLLEWDERGIFTRVEVRQSRGSAPAAAGPVLPGMANVHSHAFQRAMAGLAEFRGHLTDDFWTWREEMYRLVRLLEPEDVEAIARHLYVEMLEHGYTSVGEFHYIHNDREGKPYADRAEMSNRIIAAAGDAGIALTLMPVLYAHGGFGHRPLSPAQRRFGGNPQFVIELARELRDFHLPHPSLRIGVAPHSVRAVDALMLTELVDTATRMDAGMPIHMHLSEQTGEVVECASTHGATPFEWVSDLVDVDERWSFIHSTHLTQLEMRKLLGTGAAVGLCPVTEANLGDGIFEFEPWFEARAPWCIGGDSHVSVSPFEELRALEYSQRLRKRVRNVAASEEFPDVAANLWRDAALGGARVLAQPAGTMEPGRRADFVVLDGSSADLESLAAPSILGVAMFGGNSQRVCDVFMGGAQVVAQGRHPRKQEAQDGYRAALRRLRSKP